MIAQSEGGDTQMLWLSKREQQAKAKAKTKSSDGLTYCVNGVERHV
jgi:hypothetical protein